MKDLELRQSQRYYHFVALRGNKGTLNQQFFTDFEITKRDKIDIAAGGAIYRLSMASEVQYYRGEADYSQNENNAPPFLFDIVLIECPTIDATILGFPFKKMTMDLVNSLVSKYQVQNNFLKVDMAKLIHAYDEFTDLAPNGNHFFLGSVFLAISGDSFLSTVKLSGDKPLDSNIYKEYFKHRLDNQESRLDKSVLKCKVKTGDDELSRKVISSTHIDKFGNYKMYIQTKGKNIFAVPIIFEFLQQSDCLLETQINPMRHILDEEE